MNILYYSKLNGAKCAGMTVSVPSQIESQSELDNVFWINLGNAVIPTPKGIVKCNTIDDYPNYTYYSLPKPFDKPDLVIFQGVYHPKFCMIAKELRKQGIPYIIIPRSSLTAGGQRLKPLKKKIGNIILFNRFVKGSLAIHYLSQQEFIDSGRRWNSNYFVIPNGISEKDNVKKYNMIQELKGVFVGRLKIYQKGIDLLIQSCFILQNDLRDNNVTISIYGPDLVGTMEKIRGMIVKAGIEDILFLKGAVYGDKKEKALLEHDFFILTSRFEGHPMGLIEALSYGLPCLVTIGSNMADEIKKADAGWASETNVTAITEEFKKLINQRNFLKRKGRNALGLSKKYNWNEIARQSHKEYIDLLDRRSST